jgi:hypothetical protein
LSVHLFIRLTKYRPSLCLSFSLLIHFFVYPSLCPSIFPLSVHPSVYPPIHLSIYQSVHSFLLSGLYFYPSVHLSMSLSLYLLFHPFICLSHPSIHPPIHLSTHPSVPSSICLSYTSLRTSTYHLFVHPFIDPFNHMCCTCMGQALVRAVVSVDRWYLRTIISYKANPGPGRRQCLPHTHGDIRFR